MFPTRSKDVEELWSALVRSVDSFSDPSLQALVRSFLDDPVFAAAFREAPAAKSLHHAWLGGLLEHVVSLLGICDLAAQHYPEINRDLLLTGAILHDIGKLEELRWGTSFDYTLEGQLVGHITLGIAMIEKKLAALPGLSARAPHVGRAHGSESSWQTGVRFAQTAHDSGSGAAPLPRRSGCQDAHHAQ